MDTTGQVFLGVAIVVIVAAVIGYYILSQKGPRGAVLAVAVGIYFLGHSIPTAGVRELHLIRGILSLTGIIGGILGVIDLFKSKPQARVGEVPVEAEIVEEAGDGR